MIIVIVGAIAIFYLGLNQIRSYALEVTHASEDASASGSMIEQLKTLQTQLAEAKALVDRADRIYSTDITYQSQAVKDLQKYASEAGVSITNTDFTQPETADPSYRVVKISLAQPVSYEHLLRFLQLIEGSLPKMQAEGISITRPLQPDGDAVGVNDITIRIAVK